jgi:hypothetical protein
MHWTPPRCLKANGNGDPDRTGVVVVCRSSCRDCRHSHVSWRYKTFSFYVAAARIKIIVWEKNTRKKVKEFRETVRRLRQGYNFVCICVYSFFLNFTLSKSPVFHSLWITTYISYGIRAALFAVDHRDVVIHSFCRYDE